MKAKKFQIQGMSKTQQPTGCGLISRLLEAKRKPLSGSTMLEYSAVGASILVVCVFVFTGLGENFFKAFAPFLAFMHYQQANTNLAPISPTPSDGETPSAGGPAPGGPSTSASSDQAGDPSHTAGANGSKIFAELSRKLTLMANKYHKQNNQLGANVLYKLANEGDIMGQYLAGTISLQQAQDQARSIPGLEGFSKFLQALAGLSEKSLSEQIQAFKDFYQNDVLSDPGYQQLASGDQQTVNVLVNASVAIAIITPILNQLSLNAGGPGVTSDQVAAIFNNAAGIHDVGDQIPGGTS